MHTVGISLIVLGLSVGAICKCWLLLMAFQRGGVWGPLSLLPFGQPLFIFTHWEDAALPVVMLGVPSLCLFSTGAGLFLFAV